MPSAAANFSSMPSNAGSSCTQRIVSEAKQPPQATHGLMGRSASERNSVSMPSPARTSSAVWTRMSVLPPDRGLPEIPNTFIISRSIACFFPLATIVPGWWDNARGLCQPAFLTKM